MVKRQVNSFDFFGICWYILVKNEKIKFFLILQLQRFWPWEKIRNLIGEKNPLKIVKFAFINISVVKKQVKVRILVPMLDIAF